MALAVAAARPKTPAHRRRHCWPARSPPRRRQAARRRRASAAGGGRQPCLSGRGERVRRGGRGLGARSNCSAEPFGEPLRRLKPRRGRKSATVASVFSPGAAADVAGVPRTVRPSSSTALPRHIFRREIPELSAGARPMGANCSRSEDGASISREQFARAVAFRNSPISAAPPSPKSHWRRASHALSSAVPRMATTARRATTRTVSTASQPSSPSSPPPPPPRL